MHALARNEDAERAISAVAKQILGDAAIESVGVDAIEDHVGEPALSVRVRLRKGGGQPSGAEFIALVKAMRDALQDLEDTRFPYLSFSASGDEESEDTRRSA